MNLFRRLMRFFFHHFYHSFAWTYDFVASLVSIGRWDDWVQAVIPFIQGENVLEVGHGPGHLQYKLIDANRFNVGLDESAQMGRLAKLRLLGAGQNKFKLIRGQGEMLPLKAETFDTVISTFPTEYIFEQQTLSEIYRILRSDGLLIVLPAAWIVGQKLLDRGAAWLFKVTGQAPAFPHTVISQRLAPVFKNVGFKPEFKIIEIRSSVVLIVIANKSLVKI
jgi:ubiquinone/menaquinone biosynthesis C-methylase UbiE